MAHPAVTGAAALDFALLAAAVALLAASQVLQKLAARRFAAARCGRLAAFMSPELGWAVATLACGTALWLTALYRVDISRAVPFLSLGQLLVLVFSRAYLREPLSRVHVFGALLIAAGVSLVAVS
jgi:drug/metabolite transporter (DMT)-like permease